ncbi:MAG: ATP-binding protein [bacterium]|nr:ATP-binding protein [bacterium]
MSARPLASTAPSPNPFSPDFGQVPDALVGRDDLLADLYEGLDAGPGDSRYTSILLGVRGSGKTVVLTEAERHAASCGWIVLSVDAGTNGLLDRISQAIRQTPRKYESLDLGGLGGRRTTTGDKSLKVGPYQEKRSEQEVSDPDADMGLREELALLAEKAQQAGTSVLLTVDELHCADRDEARRLSNYIQHITKRSQRPLAFIGAGLLEMRYTLMEDKRITFFRRCNRHEMPPLDFADAYKGLRFPILDAGGSVTEPALEQAAAAVGDLPYTLQVVGHTAWALADAPGREIDGHAVSRAVAIAERTVDENISEPAFHELAETEQEYLAALAALGGSGTMAEIAGRAGTTPKAAAKTHRRLDLSGYTRRDDGGTVTLTGLVPARVIARNAPGGGPDPSDGQPRTARPATAGPTPPTPKRAACRKWMPRARAYCTQPRDHSGRCRSK